MDVALQTKRQVQTASGIDIVAGIWLIIAPFALQYIDDAARWNDVLVGIAVAVLAAVRVFGAFRAAWLSWINVVLGLWLIIAPFVLAYAMQRSVWNDIIVGIIVVICAAWSALATRPDTSAPAARRAP